MFSDPALMRFAAAVREDWYCDSSTTYTIFITGRPRTSSGTMRRFSALEAVNIPPPLPISGGATTMLREERRAATLPE